MFEYQNNNYENRNQMYQHYQMPENAASSSSMPPKNRSGKKAGRFAKKIGAIALSAVLFGGVAAGSFQAVNYLLAPAPAAENTASAPENTSAGLLKAAALPNASAAKGSLDVSDIADTVMPSIVSITNKSVQEIQNYFNMFGYGGQTIPQETESRGSGIIIGKNDSELLIVTNYHVIENADTISAGFIDNQAYEANVKGTDPSNDLAVIAVPLESISADTMSQIAVASIGDSDSLKVGEQVVAIGNALGYGQSVTTGIVSATNRTMGAVTASVNTSADSAELPTYIQTDAAINPGNSGGALVNMNGEVVGINSAKMASTEVEGMGYAIPMARVSDIIENLMNETTRSKVSAEHKSSIGISGLTVDDSVNSIYGIPSGVYVAEVTAGSGADKAGIKKGYVITGFDGKTITDIQELTELLQYYPAGETVDITVKIPATGGTYTEQTLSVTLGQAQNAQNENNQTPQINKDASGYQ